MQLGRERDILRWDAHFGLLTMRLERAERQLSAIGTPAGGRDRERVTRLVQEVEQLRSQLHALGPSPRAKMG